MELSPHGNSKCSNQCSYVIVEENRLDILMNNAGFGSFEHWKTEEGIEAHLGCNHLGMNRPNVCYMSDTTAVAISMYSDVLVDFYAQVGDFNAVLSC